MLQTETRNPLDNEDRVEVTASDYAFTVSKTEVRPAREKAAKQLGLKLELLCHRAVYSNARGQLLHSHLVQHKPEGFAFEKIEYNDPNYVVMGIHIKSTGELIYSAYRHDFSRDVTGAFFIDGGRDYIRSNVVSDKDTVAFVKIDLLRQRFWSIDDDGRQASEKRPFAYISYAEGELMAQRYTKDVAGGAAIN